MKKTTLFMLLYICFGTMSAQLKPEYSVSLYNKYISVPSLSETGMYFSHCHLHFSQDKYVLRLLKTGDYTDLNEITLISFGNYKLTDRSIDFYDEMHSFKMIAKQEGGKLIFIKSFPFLMGSILSPGEYYYGDKVEDYIEYIVDAKRRKKEKVFEQQHIKDSCVIPSIYKDIPLKEYSLCLKEDGSYEFNYINVLLSIGTWKTNGSNELTLLDKNLGNFNLLIRNDSLISKLLPTDYEGLVLKPQKPW